MEKELGISYPTVRNRLDTVIEALGYRVEKTSELEDNKSQKQEILSTLERGEITPDEATRQLRTLGK